MSARLVPPPAEPRGGARFFHHNGRNRDLAEAGARRQAAGVNRASKATPSDWLVLFLGRGAILAFLGFELDR